MADWGSGYVTDIEYTRGYFRMQSPQHLAAACLMGGVATDVHDRYESLSYLELGCGLGFGAMVLAASNPGWTVTAIDFNPAHIASARAHAAASGLTNIRFLEADMATLAEDPALAAIPEADVVSAHGVWSWVPEMVRAGMVRLLRARLRAGGIFHVSYNALPAWQSALGMQRLAREAGRRLAGRSDRQASAGFAVVHALSDAKARHLHGEAFVQGMLEKVKFALPEYLAHEYMNDSWSPCFHADVARAVGDAKLEYVATAELVENFPELVFTPEQRAVVDRFDDPVMRELIKDTCLNRGLRNDVYIRGPQRTNRAARDAALGKIWIGLLVRPEHFQFEANMPTGLAEFGRDFYGAVVAALADGPRPVGELVALPGRSGNVENPAELIAIMVGSQQAEFVARPHDACDATARRFNAVTAQRLVDVDRIGRGAALASTRLGAGLTGPLVEQAIVARSVGGVTPDPAELAAELGPALQSEEVESLRVAIAQCIEKRRRAWETAAVL
jgi:SAM-dependent methyltransferase